MTRWAIGRLREKMMATKMTVKKACEEVAKNYGLAPSTVKKIYYRVRRERGDDLKLELIRRAIFEKDEEDEEC